MAAFKRASKVRVRPIAVVRVRRENGGKAVRWPLCRLRDPIPAALLTHGGADPRVAVWHSAKAAAQFGAAAASVTEPRPVLLRLDYDAGHGVGSSKQQRQRERADIYASLLWQMGATGFQP